MKSPLEVEGQFTRHELELAQDQLQSERRSLQRLETELEERRNARRVGAAKLEADQIEAALGDEAFNAALQGYVEATTNLKEATRAKARCKTYGRLTETARKRIAQYERAVKESNAAKQIYEQECSRLKVQAPHYGTTCVSWYRRRVLSLRQSYDVESKQQEVEETTARVLEKECEVEAMVANLVDEATLARFARYMDKTQRRILYRMVRESYHPKPKTLKGQAFMALHDLGLIELSKTYFNVQPIGRDVANWIANHMAGDLYPQGDPAISRAMVKRLFSADELNDMRRTATLALKEVLEGGDEAGTLELGVEGCRYTIFRTRKALTRFLNLIGTQRKAKGSVRCLSRPKPRFVPGRLLQRSAST